MVKYLYLCLTEEDVCLIFALTYNHSNYLQCGHLTEMWSLSLFKRFIEMKGTRFACIRLSCVVSHGAFDFGCFRAVIWARRFFNWLLVDDSLCGKKAFF